MHQFLLVVFLVFSCAFGARADVCGDLTPHPAALKELADLCASGSFMSACEYVADFYLNTLSVGPEAVGNCSAIEGSIICASVLFCPLPDIVTDRTPRILAWQGRLAYFIDIVTSTDFIDYAVAMVIHLCISLLLMMIMSRCPNGIARLYLALIFNFIVLTADLMVGGGYYFVFMLLSSYCIFKRNRVVDVLFLLNIQISLYLSYVYHINLVVVYNVVTYSVLTLAYVVYDRYWGQSDESPVSMRNYAFGKFVTVLGVILLWIFPWYIFWALVVLFILRLVYVLGKGPEGVTTITFDDVGTSVGPKVIARSYEYAGVTGFPWIDTKIMGLFGHTSRSSHEKEAIHKEVKREVEVELAQQRGALAHESREIARENRETKQHAVDEVKAARQHALDHGRKIEKRAGKRVEALEADIRELKSRLNAYTTSGGLGSQPYTYPSAEEQAGKPVTFVSWPVSSDKGKDKVKVTTFGDIASQSAPTTDITGDSWADLAESSDQATGDFARELAQREEGPKRESLNFPKYISTLIAGHFHIEKHVAVKIPGCNSYDYYQDEDELDQVMQSPKPDSPFFDGANLNSLGLLWNSDQEFAGTAFAVENWIVTIDHNVTKQSSELSFTPCGTMTNYPLGAPMRKGKLAYWNVPAGLSIRRLSFWTREMPDSGTVAIMGFPQDNPFGDKLYPVLSIKDFFKKSDTAYAHHCSTNSGMSGSPVLLGIDGMLKYVCGVQETGSKAKGGYNVFYHIPRAVIEFLRGGNVKQEDEMPTKGKTKGRAREGRGRARSGNTIRGFRQRHTNKFFQYEDIKDDYRQYARRHEDRYNTTRESFEAYLKDHDLDPVFMDEEYEEDYEAKASMSDSDFDTLYEQMMTQYVPRRRKGRAPDAIRASDRWADMAEVEEYEDEAPMLLPPSPQKVVAAKAPVPKQQPEKKTRKSEPRTDKRKQKLESPDSGTVALDFAKLSKTVFQSSRSRGLPQVNKKGSPTIPGSAWAKLDEGSRISWNEMSIKDRKAYYGSIRELPELRDFFKKTPTDSTDVSLPSPPAQRREGKSE